MCAHEAEKACEHIEKMHERRARGDTGAGLCAEHKLCRNCRTNGLRVAELCFYACNYVFTRKLFGDTITSLNFFSI
jgi:hypothetical protein